MPVHIERCADNSMVTEWAHLELGIALSERAIGAVCRDAMVINNSLLFWWSIIIAVYFCLAFRYCIMIVRSYYEYFQMNCFGMSAKNKLISTVTGATYSAYPNLPQGLFFLPPA